MFKIFLKILFHLSRYANKKIIIDLIYIFKDPWNISSPYEKLKFESINNYLKKKNVGKVFNIIFEVGSGEGFHSKHLAKITNNLISLEFSLKAIKRAKENNKFKNIKYINADFETYLFDKYYDLIVASEIIYYFKNVNHIIKKIDLAGKHHLITYYDNEHKYLKDYFSNSKYEKTEITYGSKKCHLVYW